MAILVAGIFLGTGGAEYEAFTADMEAHATEKFDSMPLTTYIILGVSGFFVLANLPPTCAPQKGLEGYFEPGTLDGTKSEDFGEKLAPGDKYGRRAAPAARAGDLLTAAATSPRRYFLTKCEEYMRFNAALWVLLNFTMLAVTMMARDYSLVGWVFVLYQVRPWAHARGSSCYLTALTRETVPLTALTRAHRCTTRASSSGTSPAASTASPRRPPPSSSSSSPSRSAAPSSGSWARPEAWPEKGSRRGRLPLRESCGAAGGGRVDVSLGVGGEGS